MQLETSKHIEKLSFAEGFNLLSNAQFPFALWRSPKENNFQFIVSNNPEIKINKISFEDMPAGFLMAPFETSPSLKPILITADLHQKFQNFDQAILDDFEPLLRDLKKKKDDPKVVQVNKLIEDKEIKKDFIRNVTQAISEIKAGTFEKVVLSRQKEIAVSERFNPIEHFREICKKYPEVFCSLVYLPSENTIWIGASPEGLVHQNAEGIFETMSLAGTQSAYSQKDQTLISCQDALWRQKEIEEQALVSRYIINCFKKIRVREYEEIGPKTVKAGNLLHLQTRFIVDSQSINFPQIGTVMLDLLHPTSAVCGMPKAPALEFIKANETYNRNYYSGFLGPININHNSQLFVNLRSMKYSLHKITLFAGCGITGDSDPEKEWIETEMKLSTVMPSLTYMH